jgi:hypothetical protein
MVRRTASVLVPILGCLGGDYVVGEVVQLPVWAVHVIEPMAQLVQEREQLCRPDRQ